VKAENTVFILGKKTTALKVSIGF